MIITIDGPSGTGKSTVAKGVAKRLGFLFFDTGAMYRSLAWNILQAQVATQDEEAIRNIVDAFQFDIQTTQDGDKRYFVGGIDVTSQIRTQEISLLASHIATLPFVRKALVKIQRSFGHRANAVFEGRDMGTVVFPDAELKVFLTAKPEVRAKRRYRELLLKFPDLADSLSQEQILSEIEQRDHNDQTRAISPLRQAKDALLIDTSDLTADDVIDQIARVQKTLRRRKKFEPMHFSYALVYHSVRAFLKLFYRLRIYGLSHFRSGASIIAANHASFFDPPVISVSCPQEVHFLARESLFRIPLLGRLIRILNSHPVARDASDANTFRQLIQLLQSGQKVILFPEGKRSEDGQLQPLEKGLSFLVYKARCGILPVYVSGTREVWKRGSKFPRLFGKVSCVFGSPIEWEEFEGIEKREAMERITNRTEQAIRSLKEWFDNGAVGDPP